MDLKRPAPIPQSPEAKRHQSPQHTSNHDVHIRTLIEPNLCARIMGSKGSRLRDLRRGADDTNKLNAWVSPDDGFEFRVMHVTGIPLTVAKFYGLLVRTIFEEDLEPSSSQSREYELKLLCPHPLMGKLIGSKMAVMKDIESKSAARLSAGRDKLPRCDDRIVNIFGVADAIHIAMFHVSEILQVHTPDLRFRPVEYQPSREHLGIRPFREYNDHGHTTAVAQALGKPLDSRFNIPNGTPTPPQQHHTDTPSPSLHLPANASIPLQTAFETAKDSQREQLRQIIKVPAGRPHNDLEYLIENMKRVTSCTVKLIDEEEGAIQLEGPPEDNALAIYLAWRYGKTSQQ